MLFAEIPLQDVAEFPVRLTHDSPKISTFEKAPELALSRTITEMITF